MRPGYFFEISPGADLREEQIIFSYKRISIIREFPIYLILGSEKVEVCFSTTGQNGNNTMFELIFSNYTDPKGKLSQQLLDIPTWSPFVTELQEDIIGGEPAIEDHNRDKNACYSNILSGNLSSKSSKNLHIVNQLITPFLEEFGIINEVNSDSKPNAAFTKEETEGNSNLTVRICLKTIFLDFLFDLKHSDVFSNSKYYDLLLFISRSNFVFDSIIKVCEYHYWRRDHLINPGQNINTGLAAWQMAQKKMSIQYFINLLMTKEASTLLGESAWINHNLETSLFQAVDEFSDTYDSIDSRGDESLWHQVSEWATRRYSYLKFIRAIFSLNWIHYLIILFPFISIFFTVLFAKNELDLSSQAQAASYGILNFIIVIIIFGILYFCSDVRKFGKSQVPFWRAMLILISPKIVLSSVFAWGAFEALSSDKSNFTHSFENTPFIMVALGALLIPLLYLYRELLEEAPDLTSGKIVARTISAEIVVLTTIFLIGVPTLIFTNMMVFDPVQNEATVSIIKEVFLATPFVFFTLIFMKTLFAGKRFTGM